MISLVRSELYRMATIRSSWISLVLFGSVAGAFGVINAYGWALCAGLGAFGIAVLTVAQHHQHRTIALLYLARPRRLRVLIAQVITTVIVALVFAALSGITVVTTDDNHLYRHTLFVVPVMAVFGAATAAIVRRASWLLIGFGVWFVIVECLVGQLKQPLPISAYLEAAEGNAYGMEVFVVWSLGTLAIAALTLRRDLTSG